MELSTKANQNLCIAIWLQLKEDKFVYANQVSDWVLCSKLIELRVDGADNTVVLTKKNIKNAGAFWREFVVAV